ncbi:MAG TPA: Gfo/Idh/MocA family oxidoreductase [Planctomycetes bacterium]|nr:Gfo/Idh/MocA family oxidoreductase [Fuerstiella sp.]HIK96468.1 Gfo/Idh/MocA family oxidoreductase [Planctomycetota bacterium]
MASVRKLTAAVIGTGFIGPVHVEGLQRAGVTVSGILGSTAEKSRLAAEQLGLENGYASLDELLADDDVDVVHITSPNRHHFEQTSRTLQAGKHVLCEKPLAMNSRESAKLLRIAGESGKVAGVNYNIRYYPLCLEAADKVRRGEVGELFHVSGCYVQDWLFHETDFNWRVVAEDGGELRAVADIGTHWLDLVQFITDRKVTAVCADLQTVYPTRQRPVGGAETFSGKTNTPQQTAPVDVTTEDSGAVMLKFQGGGRGVMSVSQVTAGRKNCLRFELAGSKRALEWCSERPNEMWIGQRDQPNETLLRDPALMGDRANRHADYPGGHNQGFPDTFKQLFRDFYGYIAAGDFTADRTFPTFADGHREILLCEAILQSHREQKWVEVNDQN